MPVLTLTSYVSSAAGLSGAMITDLAIVDPGGGAGPTLYATTGYSGTISAWDLTTTGPRQVNSSAHTRTDAPGTTACISFINTAQGPAVLTGGGSKGALVMRDLDTNGALGAQQNLGTIPALAGDLIATVSVTLSNGTQMVYGGMAGAGGVGRLTFSTTGSLTGSGVTADTTTTYADRVVALAEATIGGQQYLFTASAVNVGITCWQVSSTGSLTARFSLGNTDGLWIGTPTAMDVAVVGGQTFLVLAAAGSNTMTLIAVANDGTMRVTDTVMDDLNSRFAGATAMDVVSHGGQSYVIAGGGDDGISVYQILPGGQFLALAHLADTAAMGLSDVSAIVAQSTPAGIEIFVGSSSETGLTQLGFDPGPAGQTLIAVAAGSTLTGTTNNDVLAGSNGNDILSGANGNDILTDGAGSDRLTGGSGADVFVLTSDGILDTITDFTPGTDKIDLSGWNLRGVSQLLMEATPTGLQISFGTEVLIVNSSTGTTINPGTLTEADLLNLTRIGTVIPTINVPPSTTGNSGNNVLIAGAGNDTLRGFEGNDSLFGGNGNDALEGGLDGDLLEGGLGNDAYFVDDFWDVIMNEVTTAEAGGFDTVDSWVDFRLPWNVEVLQFQGDDNLIGVGNDGADTLIGNAGATVLDALGGNDRALGGGGSDVVIGGSGLDTLLGEEGNDSLYGGDGIDWLDGGADGDLLEGGLGNDTYIIDDIWDVIWGEVTTPEGGGFEIVDSWVSFRLPENVEVLRLQGSGHLNGVGTSGADTLVGNAGINILEGQGGRDLIEGGSSNDILVGGKGADTLVGGAWADTFVYYSTSESAAGRGRTDLIIDFERGADLIDLSYIDANRLVAGDQAFRYIGIAGFTGNGSASAGELRIAKVGATSFLVEADTNGDLVADLRIQVTGIDGLNPYDFIF